MSLLDKVKTFVVKEREEPRKEKKVKEKAPKPKKVVKAIKERPEKEEKPAVAKQAEREKGPAKKAPKISFGKAEIKDAYRFLKSPYITEKATDLTSQNKYTFKITASVNKPQIRKAIEESYGVKVTGVRVINIPRKKRRLGRTEGYKSGYRKAIVSLRKGDKIEVLPH